MRWQNWNGNQRAHPDRWPRPGCETELQEAMAAAWAAEGCIRPVGGSHAWSGLVPGARHLIDTSGLTDLVQLDPVARTMTVQPGVTMGQAMRWATERGFVLPDTTVYPHITVGGAVATGSHGTGLAHGSIGDALVDFTLIAADGSRYTGQDAPELWPALRTNLGLLGVLSSVTFRLREHFNLLEAHRLEPVHPSVEQLRRRVDEHAYVEWFWFPGSENALTVTGDPTDMPVLASPTWRTAERIRGYLGSGKLAPLAYRTVARLHPRLSRSITRNATALWKPLVRTIDPQGFFQYNRHYGRMWDSEIGVPLDLAVPAIQETLDRVHAAWRAGRNPVDMVVHARFCGPSEGWLAPAQGRATCHLEVVSSYDNAEHHEFFGEFEAAMCEGFEGRPHWGKVIVDPDRMAGCYPRLADFQAVRRRLDPRDRLLSPHLARLLGSAPGEPS